MEVLQCIIISAVVFAVFACRLNTSFKYTVKYALYHLYLIFVFALAIIPCCFRPGNADNIIIGRFMYRVSKFAWWLLGVDIISEGHENLENVKAPAVIMCNHQSSLDALVIAKVDISSK